MRWAILFLGLGLMHPGEGSPFVDKYLSKAIRLEVEGNLTGALEAVSKAIEGDDQHLGALLLWADLAQKANDLDSTVYALHRWMTVVEAHKTGASRSQRKAIEKRLLGLDEKSPAYRKLTVTYGRSLHKLAMAHRAKGRLHSAIEVLQEILSGNPLDREAKNNIKLIRREGGKDVAKEEIYAGGDPLSGVDSEWVITENAKHDDWDSAWEKDSENYRYKTDGGYLILQTASIAMEQMNKAYRRFFHFKEDGSPTPKINVLIYKNRKEYLEENGLPENDWTGGFFNGRSVQTFLGGQSGKESVRGMYGTLFHEAAHQFVSLTGKGGVPGWLNEAYASFFEGVIFLSNGQVLWNRIAKHRLMPLARRMENGWMDGPADGVRDKQGEWATPKSAPDLRMLVQNQYRWGPPWYAPTWGVVYFLYNFRTEDGRLIYRKALHNYYLSGASSKGLDGRVPWFEEVILKGSPLSPVQTIDELSTIWSQWILELRDIEMGRRAPRKSNLEFSRLALLRKDRISAKEFLEEAILHQPDDPDVLWEFANFLEKDKEWDRSAALYRSFAREIQVRGMEKLDSRFETARDKMVSLDPLHRRHQKLRNELLVDGLQLAESYRSRDLPLMALDISRRMSAQYSLPQAIDFYAKVSKESGKSLARWKVAYNEFDLTGWAGSEGYRAYGNMIEGAIQEDSSIVTKEGNFQTKELTCEVTFDADYSLEAELKFGPQATLMGLCFGRKDPQATHAVVLHPSGFLDISTKDGGLWTYHDHRAVKLDTGWQKLRIDVVKRSVDVYLNDKFVRSLKMPSRDSVRGAFGLITGTGTSFYRNIRILSRDAHDPAARVERAFKLDQLAKDDSLRETGSYSNFAPPEPVELDWIQGTPTSFAKLKGRPTALIFWSEHQESVIPTSAYYAHLQRKFKDVGLQLWILIGGEHSHQQAQKLIEKYPIPGALIARDPSFESFRKFNVVQGGWGMPRILLVDVDGLVTWEGDPGLLPGVGWVKGSGETYFDGPLKILIQIRHLEQITKLKPRLKIAEKYAKANLAKEALETLEPLISIDAPFSATVSAAKILQNSLEVAAATLLQIAVQDQLDGNWITAEKRIAFVVNSYMGTDIGDLAHNHLRKFKKKRTYRAAAKAWQLLSKVPSNWENEAKSQQLLEDAHAASEVAEILKAIDSFRTWKEQALTEGEVKEAWDALQPLPQWKEQS